MSEQWYIYQDNQQKGPFSRESIEEQVQQGKLGSQDLVWSQGMAEWQTVGSIDGLIVKDNLSQTQSGPVPPPPPISSKPPAPAKKKKSGLKIAGIVLGSLVILFIVFFIIVLSTARSSMRSSEIYAQAVIALQENPQAAALLGEPIEDGNGVSGEINVSNGSGEAEFSIPVSGPLSSGDLYARGVKSSGQWSLTYLELVMENGDSLDLLSSKPGFAEDSQPTEITGGLPSDVSGMLMFNEPGYGFTMNFPEQWNYVISGNTIDFRGPEGTEENDLLVNIQVLFTSLAGGMYANLDEVFNDLGKTYEDIGGNIIESESGTDYIGDSIHDYIWYAASYESEGTEFFERVIILQRDDEFFYLLMHTAPLSLGAKYDDLIFDDMLDSFQFVAF
ncbi:MAG: cytochrome c oxidase assembly factor Coa1 family protein [Bacillota bacterium]